MVDAQRLLADLKRLRKRVEDDLRRYHAASAGREAAQAEWQEARNTRRTAETFDSFFDVALDQAAVHWILAIVFLRFLEDNGLLDRPIIAGSGERLELAQMRQREHFRAQPTDSDAEYLLAIFAEVARLPGLAGLYDPAHNPLFRLPVSGDGAKLLLDFFRTLDPATGALVHDFTDAGWATRFLGDLYQDLSEDARKRYALLQTPDFVEEWILSRTLEPALREFGHAELRMIDPTCGSGHFLLGGFARLLEEWRRHAPEMPPAAQAQRALDAVAGVDVNPFAVEIARFRLLVAALQAAGVARLAAAPDFHFQLATGDSLLHGRHFFRRELGGTEEGFRRTLRHHYAAEDTALLDAILGQQYHAVVGNPPYITPKDAAMRDAYREIYASCHMKYGLGVPFTERFFDLAQQGTPNRAAGFVGLIVANSFMKREFGKKLIQDVFPLLDLTHVVDCSGACIPGHGTPTVILFGRNRVPVASVVRTVRGVRGEPSAPLDPAHGLVWSAILAQTDREQSESDFISTEDTPRTTLNSHPWNMGGGGAAELQAEIEEDRAALATYADSVGITSFTLEDDLFLLDVRTAQRRSIELSILRPSLSGDEVRDWQADTPVRTIFPYNQDFQPLHDLPPNAHRHMWLGRTGIANNKMFGGRTKVECGLAWFEFGRLTADKLRTPLTITFGEVATHNHFVLDRGGKVFKQTAPVIKLPAGASEDDHLGLLGLLNSSTACFWLQQVCHNKGGPGGGSSKDEKWHDFYQMNGTAVGKFPLAGGRPLNLARMLDGEAQRLSANLPGAVCASATPTREGLDAARAEAEAARSRMIALQEELDWHCYRLYALHEAPPEHPDPPPLRLGERAFEIVIARRVAAGEENTSWFEWLHVTPMIDLPDHWPDDYRAVVQRRIELIETDPTLGLIERQNCKRRWEAASWEEMERHALRHWLLDRLEDPRFWSQEDPSILSTRSLADATRSDAEFQAVAELYAGRAGFDLEALVAELVAGESVPFLAALRYSETGLRKRADWEKTWAAQRVEDAIDAALVARRDEFLRAAWSRYNPRQEGEASEAYAQRMAAGVTAEHVQQAADAAIAAEARDQKAKTVGDIPVPPKYRTPDFQSAVYWRLRGGLDVPKERFISFPHCAPDADPSLRILWAGHDHQARAQALAALYVERRESDGWPPARLVPMLAGLMELVPWLQQWHNEMDDTGLRMGDYFEGFVQDQARELGLTPDMLLTWVPPATPRRTRTRRSPA